MARSSALSRSNWRWKLARSSGYPGTRWRTCSTGTGRSTPMNRLIKLSNRSIRDAIGAGYEPGPTRPATRTRRKWRSDPVRPSLQTNLKDPPGSRGMAGPSERLEKMAVGIRSAGPSVEGSGGGDAGGGAGVEEAGFLVGAAAHRLDLQAGLGQQRDDVGHLDLLDQVVQRTELGGRDRRRERHGDRHERHLQRGPAVVADAAVPVPLVRV